MARSHLVNATDVALAVDVSGADVEITVDDASVLPPIPFYLVIDPFNDTGREYCRATAVAGNVLTVDRDLDGSASTTHSAGVFVRISYVAQILDDVWDNFGSYLPLTGGQMSGNLNMGSNQIVNLTDGIGSKDAANVGQITSVGDGEYLRRDASNDPAVRHDVITDVWAAFDGAAGTYFETPDTNLLDADTAHLHQSIGGWGNQSGSTDFQLSQDIPPLYGNNVLRWQSNVIGNFTTRSAAGLEATLVAPSTEYSIGIDLASPDGLTCYSFGVREFDATGANLGNNTIDIGPIGPEFQRVERTLVTGESTAYIGIWIGFVSTAVGQHVYADRACICEGPSPSFVPSLRIVGDLDMSAKATVVDWSTSSQQVLGFMGLTGSVKSFGVAIEDGGTIYFRRFSDTAPFGPMSPGLDPGTLADGSTHILRFAHEVSGPAWSLSVDGVVTDTASDTGTPGVSDIASPILTIGDYDPTAPSSPLSGDIHYFEVRDGIDGPIVARFDSAEALLASGSATPVQYVGSDGRTWIPHGNVTLEGDTSPVATRDELAAYLPLSGGIMSGDIDMRGHFIEGIEALAEHLVDDYDEWFGGWAFRVGQSDANNKPPGQDHYFMTMAYSDRWGGQLAVDARENLWWVRSENNEVWGEWEQITTGGPYLPLSGGTMSGDLHMGGNDILGGQVIRGTAGVTLSIQHGGSGTPPNNHRINLLDGGHIQFLNGSGGESLLWDQDLARWQFKNALEVYSSGNQKIAIGPTDVNVYASLSMNGNHLAGLRSTPSSGDANDLLDSEIGTSGTTSDPTVEHSTILGIRSATGRSAQFAIEKAGSKAWVRGIVDNGPAWGDWLRLASETDLSNYLPLTGGTLTGQFFVSVNTSAAVRIRRPDIASSEWYMGYNTNKEFALRYNGAWRFLVEAEAVPVTVGSDGMMVGESPRAGSQVRNMSHSGEGPPADMKPGDVHLQYRSSAKLTPDGRTRALYQNPVHNGQRGLLGLDAIY